MRAGLLFNVFSCPSGTSVKEERDAGQVNLRVLWDETLFTGKPCRNLGLNLLVLKSLSGNILIDLSRYLVDPSAPPTADKCL